MKIETQDYLVKPGEPVDLTARPTRYEGEMKKKDAQKELTRIQKELLSDQELLHADGSRSLLIVLQAMDAGGKDSTVRRVFGPFNPNWCRVYSFKKPTETELAHDFLWRIHKVTPEKGYIGIFNRSQYEDVVIVRVRKLAPKKLIEERFGHINAFEKLLADEGTTIVKFFLNVSKDYQKERLERRLEREDKHWKFDPQDLEERKKWETYMETYGEALSRCSTSHAPWYVVPAERRWFRDILIATVVREAFRDMKLVYPPPGFEPDKIKVK